jgi:hypothetical protein
MEIRVNGEQNISIMLKIVRHKFSMTSAIIVNTAAHSDNSSSVENIHSTLSSTY